MQECYVLSFFFLSPKKCIIKLHVQNCYPQTCRTTCDALSVVTSHTFSLEVVRNISSAHGLWLLVGCCENEDPENKDQRPKTKNEDLLFPPPYILCLPRTAVNFVLIFRLSSSQAKECIHQLAIRWLDKRQGIGRIFSFI